MTVESFFSNMHSRGDWRYRKSKPEYIDTQIRKEE